MWPSTTRTARCAAQSATFDRLIVSIGRVPNTAGLDAAAIGVKLDERGSWRSTSSAHERCHRRAIGDVVRGPMLAHKAEEEGVAAASASPAGACHVDFNTVPWGSIRRRKFRGSARPNSS